MKNLRQLLGLCEHQWVTIGKYEMMDCDGDIRAYKYHLRCEKCGDITGRKV